MVDYNVVAAALLKGAEEMKSCKRNKSGTLNGNAKYAIVKRTAQAVIEAGENRTDAYEMAWSMARSFE